ncbi:MAG TPA: CFI-box-CTERM domain-containing protein [Myxococcales bacterium]
MSLGEELVLRARAEAEQLQAVVSPAGLESMRAEAMQLFEQLPEPPAYRKANDPAREKAGQLVPRATELLSRLLAARKAVPADARLPSLVRAVEAHVRALAAMSSGEITEGDHLAHEAWEAARAATSSGSFFQVQGNEAPAAIYDRVTRTSRYDPRPEPMLTVQLFCANEDCRKPAAYSVAPRYATHRFTCSVCRKPFTGHFAELRQVEARSTGKATHYVLHVEQVGGGESTLEFDDTSGGELAVAPRDLVVLLYSGTGSLAAVENLTTGHVLWILPKGPCFLATAVYGEDAPELDDFRAFRDRVLLPSLFGRAFVAGYYRVGPRLAPMVGSRPALRRAARAGLEAIRRRIHF